MEEDVGVKGTVTRLRRRLSIEKTEDVSSPSTPTKKRGGRLAAKPQLEFIDENAQTSSPIKTRRKSVAKDMTDADEKPVTPSRRSTRIKSNTSIVSESVSQTTDSPRARRALRRTSQAGSDNEGPATPARQTRRTRKDSASSVENQEPISSKPLQVVEMVITEEPETESANKSKSSPQAVAEELSPNSARKSKRLLEKRNRRSGSYKSDQDLSTGLEENKSLNVSAKDDSELKTKAKSQNSLNKSGESKEHTEQLSESNISLLKTLDAEHKINTSNHNKSVPFLDSKKKKRNRTESLPVLLNSPAHDNIMFSDNEQSKKKRLKSGNDYSWINNSNSSLNSANTKGDKNKTKQNDNDDLQILIESPTKRKSETSFSKEEEKPSAPDELSEKNVSKEESLTINAGQKSEDNADNASLKSENNGITSEIAKFFEKPPVNVQAIVYFEDSDSNSINVTNKNTQQLDSGDQCVPVVKHDLKFQEKPSLTAANLITNEQENIFATKPIIEKESLNNEINDVNTSCEPMDIDETIHEEILEKSQHSLDSSIIERKSLSLRNSISEKPIKSKRKSSITANDTSKIENKSTLILSQLKDVSKTSDSTQSPKPPTSEILSKSSTNAHENTKNIAKGNLSLNDLKGTPLRQTNVQKLNMQTSTPIAKEQIDKPLKIEEKSANLKNNSADFSKSTDESRSEEGSDQESYQKSNIVDDEAEEAGDDYESGDSRDEEERQYEDEHEIIERGETLGSEEDLTNDSDYEKDSFIVSSDAEDDDLLSGSGDDLSMSDNELNMSKKSKTKYNERKLKEQKNASREMFESRHKLNSSEQKPPALKTKSNRMRLDSSLLESDEEITAKPKKSKRLRLDSTFDSSYKQEDVNESLNNSNVKSNKSMQKSISNETKQEDLDESLNNSKKSNKSMQKSISNETKQEHLDESLKNSKKKINKSMQKSICNESGINEREITICNDNVDDTSDPLQVQFKQEPKTPQKDLDMSVVQFTSRQDIESVEVCEGKSILNQTGTDPLEATMVGEDTSDSSENEEIMQNYDSVLDNLNKNKKGNLNSKNLSLNIDKKAKKNKNEPILDQLNLTHTKRSKKIAREQSRDVVDSKTSKLSEGKQDADSLSGSSSIDLKLLFSEDNCESEDDSKPKKDKLNKEEEMFVPLRKSTGKTNIGESGDDLFFIDTTGAQDDEKEDQLGDPPVEVLFTSKKKQKKNKLDTSHDKTETNENTQPAETVSAKKKKQKKRHSATSEQSGEDTIIVENSSSKRKSFDSGKAQNSVVEALCDEDSDDAPVEAPYQSEKTNDLHPNALNSEDTPAEIGDSKKKKKKKTKQSAVSDQSVLNDADSDGAPEETPYQSEKAIDLEANLLKPDNEEPAQPGSGKKKKKKKKKQATSEQAGDSAILEQNSDLNLNKRKRKSSDAAKTQDTVVEVAQESAENEALNESCSGGSKKKKRKISHRDEAIDENDVQADGGKKKKKNREINFQNIAPEIETVQTQIKKNKKRKERDEDVEKKNTKVSKDNSLHEVHMPPLPENILSQLDDKPRKIIGESKVVSTSKFVVENSRQKRAKPSKYLEESIYLNADSPLAKKDKSRMKKPKVLPFIPTASISDYGFTTNFQIKNISQNVQFIAGPAEMTFSKETYFQKKGIKKLGTYDHYKKQMSRKLCKF